MLTVIQTIVSWLPMRTQMSIGIMDARMFYEFVAIVFTAPVVAAAALRHWRRRRTWLAAVVIVELVCLAAMAVMALAFNVVDYDSPFPKALVVTGVYYYMVIALSRVPDGLAWAVTVAARRMGGHAPNPAAP